MSRESILQNLKKNKPASSAGLPEIPAFVRPEENLAGQFTSSLENNKARVILLPDNQDLRGIIQSEFKDARQFFSTVGEIPSTLNGNDLRDVASLDTLDVVIIAAEVAVADTGAMWISDKTIPSRVLPFITKELVILVEKKVLVGDMHEAYAMINPGESGYGVFISGPSKTADIEQALVVGAHGPLGLTVILRI
jgi:L-lactate dehydrogenase complex protein LldG